MTRDDGQRPKTREFRNDVLSDSVAEVLLRWVVAQVAERQDCNRRLRGIWRRVSRYRRRGRGSRSCLRDAACGQVQAARAKLAVQPLGLCGRRNIELALQQIPAEVVLAEREPHFPVIDMKAHERAVTFLLQRVECEQALRDGDSRCAGLVDQQLLESSRRQIAQTLALEPEPLFETGVRDAEPVEEIARIEVRRT